MTNPYTQPTLSGYNTSPPSDDGSATSANSLKWATHINKIGDPLKTFAQAVDSNIATAFGKIFGADIATKSANYTVLTTDQGKVIEVDATATITLLAAATAGAGFALCIVNTSSASAVTVDGDGSETINGLTSIVLAPKESLILTCNATKWIGALSRVPYNNIESLSAGHTAAVEDRGRLFECTAALTLVLLATADATEGFWFAVLNTGSGNVTIDPAGSELINGDATYTVTPNAFAIVVCTGSAWLVLGDYPTASATAAGIIEIATNAETKTGTDTARAVTPDDLHQVVLSFTWTGTSRLTGSAGTSGWTVTNPAVGKSTITHNLGLSDVDALQLVPGLARTANGDASNAIVNRGANSFEVWSFIAGTLTDIEGAGALTVAGYLTE